MNYVVLFGVVYGVVLMGAVVNVLKSYKPEGSYSISPGAVVLWIVAAGLIAACSLPPIAVSVEAVMIRNEAMRVEGVPDVRLAIAGARALETLAENVSLNIDWSNSSELPDDVVRQLAVNQAELLSILREQAK